MMDKRLINRLTAAGANALLDSAVRQALLDDMMEIPLDSPIAEVAGVDPPEDEDAWIAGARVERVNVDRVTPSTRMQAEIDASVRIYYGPCNRPQHVLDPADPDGNGFPEDIQVGGRWYKNQRPMKGTGVNDAAASWACSTKLNASLSRHLNVGPLFRRANGASAGGALKLSSAEGGFAEYVEEAFGGDPVEWKALLASETKLGLVNVVRIGFKKGGVWKAPSHVVMVLRCGPPGSGLLELRAPATGRPCEGLWRYAADGYFRDVPSTKAVADNEPGAYREYSAKPTVFRAVAPDDSGRAYVHRVVDLAPDGRAPKVPGGVYHLNDPHGFRVLV